VLLPSLQARLAFSNIVQKTAGGVAVLPEEDTDLLKRVAVMVRTPERREPSTSVLPRFADGAVLDIGPGTSSGVDTGVYEIQLPIDTYGSVLASVSFRVRASWSKDSRYVCDLDNIAPIYLGLEYGVRNTGLFVFLRDDGAGGSLVLGGPLLAYNQARGAETEIPGVGWTTLSDGDIYTVFFYIDAGTQTAQIWVQNPSDSAPTPIDPALPLSMLGEFRPADSSFSQRRSGPSLSATLYFGNMGGAEDLVEITDWAIYPYAPLGIMNGEGQLSHSYRRRPDLPYSFFATDQRLPVDQGLGRWQVSGTVLPEISFWYQPGRKTVPLYATIHKEALHGEARISRLEPRLTTRQDGFSVEAWMSGKLNALINADTGLGIRVSDGAQVFQLIALDTELQRSLGIVKNTGLAGDVAHGYYTASTDDVMSWVDYRTLKLVRLTVDRRRGELRLFVEDMDTPFLTVPLASEFPTDVQQQGRIDIGHLSNAPTLGDVNVASINYLNHYLAWEKEDSLPSAAPVSFELLEEGGGTAVMQDSKLAIEKTSFGPGDGRGISFYRPGDFTLHRGFQLDFRARVSSYTDASGASNAPNQWTGIGATVFFGRQESPLNNPFRIHIGFFDCGVYGRKIGIIPGNGGLEDEIIQQTAIGRLYSTDADWMQMKSYRLVYRPYHRIEVYGSNYIMDTPLISIPWDQFTPHPDDTDAEPGIAFGNFNSHNYCISEWEYLRWGVSSGFDFELLQEPHGDTYFTDAFGGRALAIITADEESGGGSGGGVS
jgi:hypothetical protein